MTKLFFALVSSLSAAAHAPSALPFSEFTVTSSAQPGVVNFIQLHDDGSAVFMDEHNGNSRVCSGSFSFTEDTRQLVCRMICAAEVHTEVFDLRGVTNEALHSGAKVTMQFDDFEPTPV